MRMISDDELEELLARAAKRGAREAVEEMTQDVYQTVGKKVITKMWQVLGMAIVGFCVWAIQHGWFK